MKVRKPATAGVGQPRSPRRRAADHDQSPGAVAPRSSRQRSEAGPRQAKIGGDDPRRSASPRDRPRERSIRSPTRQQRRPSPASGSRTGDDRQETGVRRRRATVPQREPDVGERFAGPARVLPSTRPTASSDVPVGAVPAANSTVGHVVNRVDDAPRRQVAGRRPAPPSGEAVVGRSQLVHTGEHGCGREEQRGQRPAAGQHSAAYSAPSSREPLGSARLGWPPHDRRSGGRRRSGRALHRPVRSVAGRLRVASLGARAGA